jgi:hypothetical protein
MKTLFVLAVGLSAVLPVKAQLFTPESFSGAAFGAVTGALLGGRHAGEAAAIGAGSGYLLGTIIHEARRDHYDRYYSPYYYGGYYDYGYPTYGYGVQVYPRYYVPPSVTVTHQTQAPAATAAADPPQPLARVQNQPPPSAMSSANSLFGR